MDKGTQVSKRGSHDSGHQVVATADPGRVTTGESKTPLYRRHVHIDDPVNNKS